MNTASVIQLYAALTEETLLNHVAHARAQDLRAVVHGMPEAEIVRYDWDKFVFGVSDGDITDLDIRAVRSAPADMVNVDGQDMARYFGNAPLESLPPVEVQVYYAEFYLADGHHRYQYAKDLGAATIRAQVEIKDNPLKYLGVTMDQLVAMSRAAL